MSKGVPIRSYVNTLALVMAIGFAAIILTLDRKNGEANKLALSGAEEAIKVAVKNIEEKDIHRNGLIDQMREQASHYVTRANVYSALIMLGTCATIYGATR